MNNVLGRAKEPAGLPSVKHTADDLQSFSESKAQLFQHFSSAGGLLNFLRLQDDDILKTVIKIKHKCRKVNALINGDTAYNNKKHKNHKSGITLQHFHI